MNSVTLRQLRYFEALLRHRHFGRAAEAAAVSQPALSVQIRALEEALGGPLFERGPREVRPTPFGTRVAAEVRGVLRGVEALGALAQAEAGGLTGLRIGVIPTVAPYLLPALVRGLERARPGLDLEIRETVTPRLLEALADGALDTALVALPVSEPALVELPLFREPFVLVRPESEATKPVPDARALARMRLLLLEEGHCFRDQALEFCGQGARMRHGLDGSSLATLVQMVGAGLGVTLIPEMAVAVETRSAPVAVARFADPAPDRTLGLVWRRSSPLGAELRALAPVLRAAAGASAPAGGDALRRSGPVG
ncbi:hydrogen peroxide-inducible genes activator [Jannaschia sp. W003]|uniref:hydrogen peroxide-inducible genes activator n=1 Tax=Jannaschia sp. W003 TaxID=2867012 RepID=UPI0021A59DDE|nr:hydrogen peroxide-inducible genes activator [Jannaschia sp. W003]UWQ21747.1 LysR family transcriptional regulator [Jannaschia sp. W003]